MNADNSADARTALDAYTSVRAMNMAMWRALSDAQRDRTFTHPEFGPLSVAWVAAQMAGHDIHHLKQFERIAETTSNSATSNSQRILDVGKLEAGS